ncbi:GNAT family N-acetyltransferase [Micromonospora sp. 4G55]|uniref:GNAT family N-acetyltransferase n=1 Tax=Micromonospora sp. 4G55 TaxID=2806102 RepID=UPI001EE489C8|nr:GNAT family N-acetyltransferase [Micromonospora sp. 4G55]
MPELIAPTVRLHRAWLEAHAEWGPGLHEDGFGLGPSDEVDSPTGFATWVARLTDQSDPAKTIDVGKRPCTYRWIVERDRVLGGIVLRHGSDDYMRWAGHIGYGIRPAARRRGLATWALGRMLDEALALGLDRLLAVCAVDNVASAKTIERCGGVFEGIRDTKFGTRQALLDRPLAIGPGANICRRQSAAPGPLPASGQSYTAASPVMLSQTLVRTGSATWPGRTAPARTSHRPRAS